MKINEHGYILYQEKLFISIFKNLQHIYMILAFDSYLFSYVKYIFSSNDLIIALLRYVYSEYYIIQCHLNIQELVIFYILSNQLDLITIDSFIRYNQILFYALTLRLEVGVK